MYAVMYQIDDLISWKKEFRGTVESEEGGNGMLEDGLAGSGLLGGNGGP